MHYWLCFPPDRVDGGRKNPSWGPSLEIYAEILHFFVADMIEEQWEIS